MAFNENIPQATDKPKNSQSELLANFGGTKTLIDINHVTFDDPDEGKHKFVTFPRQAASPATAATDVAFYSKLSGLSGKSELFYRNQNSGTEYEFTSFNSGADGWARLPSGILLKWTTNTGSGASTVTWAVDPAIPVFSAVYNVQLTTEDTGATDSDTFVRLRAFTTTTVTLYCSARSTTGAKSATFRVLAIGL